MPRLKLICITCRTLEIYSLILDHITPSPGCELHVVHSVQVSRFTHNRMPDKPLHHMRLSLSEYANSFFKHHQDQPMFFDVELYISRDEFSFFCYSRRFKIIVRTLDDPVPLDSDTPGIPDSLYTTLLGTISMVVRLHKK